MDVLFKMINNVKSLDANEIYNSIIQEKQEFVLDLNRHQMYELGIMDVENENSQLEYRPFTKLSKTGQIQGTPRAKFPRIDHITLKWSGQFHASLKISIQKEWFLIYSNDITWQTDLKQQRRFVNALGLTDSSIDKLIEVVLPLFRKKTLDKILS